LMSTSADLRIGRGEFSAPPPRPVPRSSRGNFRPGAWPSNSARAFAGSGGRPPRGRTVIGVGGAFRMEEESTGLWLHRSGCAKKETTERFVLFPAPGAWRRTSTTVVPTPTVLADGIGLPPALAHPLLHVAMAVRVGVARRPGENRGRLSAIVIFHGLGRDHRHESSPRSRPAVGAPRCSTSSFTARKQALLPRPRPGIATRRQRHRQVDVASGCSPSREKIDGETGRCSPGGAPACRSNGLIAHTISSSERIALPPPARKWWPTCPVRRVARAALLQARGSLEQTRSA